jgi:hypothetical protein
MDQVSTTDRACRVSKCYDDDALEATSQKASIDHCQSIVRVGPGSMESMILRVRTTLGSLLCRNLIVAAYSLLLLLRRFNRPSFFAHPFTQFMEKTITGDLIEVPGIDVDAADKLVDGAEPGTNTWQLFGKFLTMKGIDSVDADHADGNRVSCAEHYQRFYEFLTDKGISTRRSSTICQAVAEKVSSVSMR